MDDIRYRLNVVAVIGAIGALIAFIGTVLAYKDFGNIVGILDLIVFGLLLLSSIVNIRPSVDVKTALLNILLGVFAVLISCFDYFKIANSVEAGQFMDVGIGVWMMLAGSVIYLIFSISDYRFKKSN